MSMDRTGHLPDDIISHILSFLLAKEAAFGRTRSKRWGNLCKIIPKLRFDGSVGCSDGSLDRFIQEVLALPLPDRVRSFSMTLKQVPPPQDSGDRITRCLSHLVVKRGVLAVKINIEDAANYSLPREVFTCKTVCTMKLGSGFVIDALPGDVFLPSLKSLYLDYVRFYASDGRCSFETLVSASPVLEELFIDGLQWESWKWCCTVSSTTLQRLTIQRRDWEHEFEGNYMDVISLDTPALHYMYYEDFVRTDYPIVNLNSFLEASLVNIHPQLAFEWRDDVGDVYNPMNLINGIQNVEILKIDFVSLDMVYVFEKLKKLYVCMGRMCWYSIPNLVDKCPNLKTFVITDSLHNGGIEDRFICPCVSDYSFLIPRNSSPVEVLKIKSYVGSVAELVRMRLLLQKASSLKFVKVCSPVPCGMKLEVMTNLVMLPRSSTNCVFEVKFK